MPYFVRSSNFGSTVSNFASAGHTACGVAEHYLSFPLVWEVGALDEGHKYEEHQASPHQQQMIPFLPCMHVLFPQHQDYVVGITVVYVSPLPHSSARIQYTHLPLSLQDEERSRASSAAGPVHERSASCIAPPTQCYRNPG